MTFQALRGVCLLAIAFVCSSCTFNPPAVIAEPSGGDLWEGSALQKIGVEELQRILAEDKGKRDADVARQLSGLELTERMSSERLKFLEQSVSGKKSQSVLVALADASVFLEPTAADVLSQPPPDLKERRRMMALTAEYLPQNGAQIAGFLRYTNHRSL